MKKLLIATAAMAVVAGAQAQSSVTVYGVVDTSYGVNTVDQGSTAAASAKTTGLADGANASNRFGVRGIEDLGGGLSAGFTLEAGLNVVNGAVVNKTNGTPKAATAAGASDQADSAVFGAATRQAFLTVGGNNTGTVLVGYKKQLESDFNDTFMIGTENSYGAEGQEINRLGRANQVGYTLPTLVNGLSVTAGYSVAAAEYDQAATADAKKYDASILSANLMYKAGNLNVGAHVGSGNITVGTGVTEQTVGSSSSVGTAAFAAGQNIYDTQAFGASYDFGVAKVSAMLGQRDTGVAGKRLETEYSNIGVAFPMGRTTLKASLSQAKVKDASGNTTRDDSGYQLQADYSLSKRTTAWAVYGVNKTEAVVAASAVSGVSAEVAAAAAIDYKTVRVGVTHSF